MTAARHIDTTETAKLVRKALAEAFPGLKFRVQSSRYSMGSSIDVSWMDGPLTKQVQAVVETFKGDYFDSMTDHHGHRYHLLDGERVHFAGSIMCRRDIGPAGRNFQAAWDQLSQDEKDRFYTKLDLTETMFRATCSDGWFPAYAQFDFYNKPTLPSATCARVQVAT